MPKRRAELRYLNPALQALVEQRRRDMAKNSAKGTPGRVGLESSEEITDFERERYRDNFRDEPESGILTKEERKLIDRGRLKRAGIPYEDMDD